MILLRARSSLAPALGKVNSVSAKKQIPNDKLILLSFLLIILKKLTFFNNAMTSKHNVPFT